MTSEEPRRVQPWEVALIAVTAAALLCRLAGRSPLDVLRGAFDQARDFAAGVRHHG